MDNSVYEHLINASIRFVSFRPRSEKELRDFLIKKLKKSHTYADPVVERVMLRMVDLGYIDDQKFAQWWVEQRSAFRPKGKKLLEQELKQKGIQYNAQIDEQTLAKKAIEKKLRVWQKLPTIDQKKKLSDYLARRGFSWDVVDEILKNK